MKSHFLSVKLDYIAEQDPAASPAFGGRVVNSLENWNGEYVIGIAGSGARIAGGTLEYQPVNRVSVLPADNRIQAGLLVANLKPLCAALLCDYLYLRTSEKETVVVVSDSWENALPYAQWILLKDAQAVVYVPRGDEDQEAALKSKWARHPFFKHPSFKTKFPKVTMRSVSHGELARDALSVTSNYGASAILVLPGAPAAFGTEQVNLHRQVLLAAGVNSRVVWCSRLEQMDPCECECAHSKGLALCFFNLDAILSTESHAGVVQHALVETLRHMCNSSLFLHAEEPGSFKVSS